MGLGLLLSKDSVLAAGTAVLILAPAAGMAAAIAKLVSEKDWKWVGAAAVLVIIISAGIAASFL